MQEKATKIKRSCLKKNSKKSASHKQDSCEGKSLWLLVARSKSQRRWKSRERLCLYGSKINSGQVAKTHTRQRDLATPASGLIEFSAPLASAGLSVETMWRHYLAWIIAHLSRGGAQQLRNAVCLCVCAPGERSKRHYYPATRGLNNTWMYLSLWLCRGAHPRGGLTPQADVGQPTPKTHAACFVITSTVVHENARPNYLHLEEFLDNFGHLKLCECIVCVSLILVSGAARRWHYVNAARDWGPPSRSQFAINFIPRPRACHLTGSHSVCLCTYNILTAERDLWINFSHATFHFLDICAHAGIKSRERKSFSPLSLTLYPFDCQWSTQGSVNSHAD